ncbi:MAG: ornithine carbamoyltransferase [Phycisphaerales bacterium]
MSRTTPTHPPAATPSADPTPPAQNAPELKGRDLLTLTQVTPACVRELFATAAALKKNRRLHSTALEGVNAVLIFEKASLRTRITFETGVGMLGGRAVYMDHSVQRLGDREAVKDYARNLERWMDCIIARVYSQQIIEELAFHTRVPVINALSDRFHPCQGLADLFTLWERTGGTMRCDGHRLRVAYVGDGNNVCHSLMHCATMLGADMTVVSPKGYEPEAAVVQQCQAFCAESGATLTVANKLAAAERHHAVYTDVWVSMGQADSAGKRRKVFNAYQVNMDVMDTASRGLPAAWGAGVAPGRAVFMHCLPAQRGVEVTDDVIDAPFSVVYDQAENRLHAQNALMYHILKP